MKYAIIGPTYPYKGGISHYTTHLVRNMRKSFDVFFVSWKRQYPAFLYPIGQKDTSSKEQIHEETVYLLDFLNPFTWIQATARIRTFHPDRLILMWVTPVQAPIYFFIALFSKLFRNTEVVYICHNVKPHETSAIDTFLIKLAFSQGNRFIVHSADDKEILKGFVKNKRIIKAYLPLFDMFPQPEHIDTRILKHTFGLKKNVLLFFGYIRGYKGLMYLIEAMPRIKKDIKDLSLLVIGEFWKKDKEIYLQRVQELGLKKDIIFIDTYVPNEDVGSFFKLSDVVVLPYISATQSAAIQTAYAFDVPVIATPVGGLKDVVVEGKTGYFIEPENPESISKTVVYFYKHRINPADIANYKKEFGWEKYIQHINEKN